MLNKDWTDYFEIQEAYDISFLDSDTENLHKDAAAVLASCINTCGCVNIDWMLRNSDFSRDELLDVLKHAIFQDPLIYDRERKENEGWLLKSQYLSGNIKNKLDTAVKMNRKYRGRFDLNVQILEKALPEKVNFEQIGFSIGSSWIPEYIYELFIKDLLVINVRPKVSFSAELGRWKITLPSSLKNSVHNRLTYGTKRMSALQIIEQTLNGGTLKIYDEVCRPERKSGIARILNRTETLEAQEKQELLQQEFRRWVLSRQGYKKRLEEIYYDKFAFTVSGRYNGGFLEMPGLDRQHFTPYPHQLDAVARIILEKDVLLNHSVGSGKTGIIIMGIHERWRIGLSMRNLVVVPNNVLDAFERDHRMMYPNDTILVIRPEDFSPDLRQSSLEKLRDGQYVAAYMAFSSFERLDMSRRFKLQKHEEKIRRCRAAWANSNQRWEKDRLETQWKHLTEDLKKMREELPYDTYTPFDELEITTPVIDEAHNFKNISLASNADSVVGLHARGSRKCDAAMEKVQYIRQQGGGVIFSTGTPLTNSISDLFVLQTYLQPEQLELLHLNHFDEWINSFATRQTGFEVDVDSQNYRIRTRFSSFHNLPELISLFANVCDFYSDDGTLADLPESADYTDIVVEKSPEQKKYIEKIVNRTERIRQKLVRATDDNLLKVTNDGRLAALDIRLADHEAEPKREGTKVYACASQVFKLWKEYPDTAQLVFSDIGTPKSGFNVYDELKDVLVSMGVPRGEIAFAHDARTGAGRVKLFNSVNDAAVRILIGSTSKLGTGVNIQKKLLAIHHLDIPWKPSDIVQREGRLIRQGNTLSKVYRFRYITAGTFDAYSWQLLENKQRFISQFMSNDLADRDARDLDDAVLTYAEIKALSVGDPLLKTRIDTSNELARLKIHERQRSRELKQMETVVNEAPALVKQLRIKKRAFERDAGHFASHREVLTREDRTAFGQEVLIALNANVMLKRERIFDYLHGFQIVLPSDMRYDRPSLLLKGKSGTVYTVNMRDARAGGCVQRIENVLTNLGERIKTLEGEIKRIETQARQAAREIKKGNLYSAQAAETAKKLLDIDVKLNRRADNGAA